MTERQQRLQEELSIGGIPSGFFRADRLPSLRAALEWGLPRCGSDAARSLLTALLVLLGELNATVLPVDHPSGEGPVVDLRITLSRQLPEGRPQRIRFSVCSGPLPDGVDGIVVSFDECANGAWRAAATAVSQLIALAAETGQGKART